VRTYTLTAPGGSTYQSETPGQYGGNRAQKVYGTMTCGSARSTSRRWPEAFLRHRVFFADEAAALAAGYRPCGSCLREKYRAWKLSANRSSQ
jgi:methylphosphotriester-DNA--protein-cysteine methyltransferase